MFCCSEGATGREAKNVQNRDEIGRFWPFLGRFADVLLLRRGNGREAKNVQNRDKIGRFWAFLGRFADVLLLTRGTWAGKRKMCRIGAKSVVFGRFGQLEIREPRRP